MDALNPAHVTAARNMGPAVASFGAVRIYEIGRACVLLAQVQKAFGSAPAVYAVYENTFQGAGWVTDSAATTQFLSSGGVISSAYPPNASISPASGRITISPRAARAVTSTAAKAATAPNSTGAWLITRDGNIGPFRLGISTEAEVENALGAPDPQGSTRSSLYYQCQDFVGCRTIFGFDSRGTLSFFLTESSRYQTDRGTRIGMSNPKAEQLEHGRVLNGCFSGIVVETPAGELAISTASGGKTAESEKVDSLSYTTARGQGCGG